MSSITNQQPARSDGPILPDASPDASSEEALRDAVGARRRPRKPPRAASVDEPREGDPADPARTRRSRRTMTVAALAIVGGLTVATLVFLGRANAQRYLLVCAADRIAAEQGRSFPPWGSRPLNGPAWKSLTLPPDSECKPRETEDLEELEHWYLELLVDRASTTLTSKNLVETAAAHPGTAAAATPLDVAAEQLGQALLLARAPERRDQRKEIERLLGDVQYWHASLRLREAATAMQDAAKQFDAAAAQRPRHVSDAAAWADLLRRMSDQLRAGPGGAAHTPGLPQAGTESRVGAPPGVALPVEPPASEGPAAAPSAPADAGLPSGGVLL